MFFFYFGNKYSESYDTQGRHGFQGTTDPPGNKLVKENQNCRNTYYFLKVYFIKVGVGSFSTHTKLAFKSLKFTIQ